MEFLMTYGWSILMVAIVVGAMYAMGAFGISTAIPNACIAQPGFICRNVSLSSSLTRSNFCYTQTFATFPPLTLSIGFLGPSKWTAVKVIAVPPGQEILGANKSDPNVGINQSNFWYWADNWGELANQTDNQQGTLFSGRLLPVTICIPNVTETNETFRVGTGISGTLYAMYSTPTSSNNIAEIGTFTTVVSS
jgi:hypothetical protein